MDDCLETNCGAGVCRDLPNPTRNISTKHCACVCDWECAEAVAHEPHRNCRNYCSFGHGVVEGDGCETVNEWVLWSGNVAYFLGTGHNNDGAFSCTCPRGGLQLCPIKGCDVAPIVNHASRNDTGKTLHERAARCTCGAGEGRGGVTRSRMVCQVHPKGSL